MFGTTTPAKTPFEKIEAIRNNLIENDYVEMLDGSTYTIEDTLMNPKGVVMAWDKDNSLVPLPHGNMDISRCCSVCGEDIEMFGTDEYCGDCN